MSVVIQVDRLSKQYRLGTIGGKRLVDDVNRWWARFRGKEDPLSKVGQSKAENKKQKTEIDNDGGHNESQLSAFPVSNLPADTIWALKDVSFEVKQGEVLGIIGRNGAGKSTLLKILSRVTGPSSGEVRVKGRIASLLEVGTGFHPELTGRENIFLNGAILGMTKAEIRGKLEEIIEFSGVEKFIDTPVKRYSSGMTVRLAFAVAAHLEPEILIIDEVLAVGDAEFQKKCLGKMGEVARNGRTVLFVSHNMAAVQNLCKTAILLADGHVQSRGPAFEIVDCYIAQFRAADGGDIDLESNPCRRRDSVTILKRLRILDPHGCPIDTVPCGHDLRIEFTLAIPHDSIIPYIGIGFDNSTDGRVFSVTTNFSKTRLPPISGICRIICTIADLPLAPGHYRLSLSAGTFHHPLMDALDSAITLSVAPSDFFGSGGLPNASLGNVLVRSEWSLVC
jgi:lipopolysaccharide transport system ATP-binding protein